MLIIALIIVTLFVAYANGANDNFKGVVTLFGSKTTNYKVAIAGATITHFAGSIVAIFLATKLIKSFAGKGLVSDAIANASKFYLTVAIAAGITIILATLTDFPISTTHGLTGVLVGAGWVEIDREMNLKSLQQSFILPLLLSPLIAITLSALFYAILRYLGVYLGIEKEWCICAGTTQKIIPIPQPNTTNILACLQTTDVAIDSVENCTQRYIGNFLCQFSHRIFRDFYQSLWNAGVYHSCFCWLNFWSRFTFQKSHLSSILPNFMILDFNFTHCGFFEWNNLLAAELINV